MSHRLLMVIWISTMCAGLALAPGCQGKSSIPSNLESISNKESQPETDFFLIAENEEQPDTNSPRIVPPFPAYYSGPLSAIHQTSDAEIVLEGGAFIEEEGDGNGAGESPGGYILATDDGDEIAWAQYAIGGLSPDRPVEIEFILDAILVPGGEEDLPLSYWVGLSDYSSFSWEWRGPYGGSESFVLNSETVRERYVNENDEFFFVVVCDALVIQPTPENPDGLTGVEIISSTTSVVDATDPDYEETIPHYPDESDIEPTVEKSVSDSHREEFTKITWTHIPDSANKENEATWYEIFRRRIDSEDRKYLGRANEPVVEFIDSMDNRGDAGDPEIGGVYEYSIKAGNSAGTTPFMHIATKRAIQLQPPKNVSSNPGEFLDKVKLEWDEVSGAVSYLIYRDTQTAAVASVRGVGIWEDMTLGDDNVHEYWIRSVLPPNLVSAFSDRVLGKINSNPTAILDVDPPGQRKFPTGSTVVFNAKASNDDEDVPGAPNNGIARFEWDWQDGVTGIETTDTGDAQHDYQWGAFSPEVTVYDVHDTVDTETVDIILNNPPQFIFEAFYLAATDWRFSVDGVTDTDLVMGDQYVRYEWCWDLPEGDPANFIVNRTTGVGESTVVQSYGPQTGTQYKPAVRVVDSLGDTGILVELIVH